MSGCLVGLIWNLMAAVFSATLRVTGFLMMLMAVSVSSLFVGVRTATDRIAHSWIERSTGNGVPIGYNPAARDRMKAAAGLMLVAGWLLTIWVIYLIVSWMV